MTDKAKLIEHAILANQLVGATNNAAIASGFDPGFNVVHDSALALQSATQLAVARAAGWLVENEPAYGTPPLAFVLYDASATDSDLTEMLGRLNWSKPLGGAPTVTSR